MKCELCGEPATVDGLCASCWELEISDGEVYDDPVLVEELLADEWWNDYRTHPDGPDMNRSTEG